MNREEALERAKILAEEGYTLLLSDDPEKGTLGILAFKVVDEVETSQLLEWPLFHGPLTLDKADVTAEEMAAFVSSGPVSLCDDARKLRMGFVRYEPEQGKSVVRQIPIARLRSAKESTLKAIMDVRDGLLEESKRFRQHRQAEITL